jgi:hypothetical protein
MWLNKEKYAEIIAKEAHLNSQIAEANKLVEECKKKLEEPNKNFTVLDCFSLNDEYFLSQLHEIVNNKAFLFHMHSLKTDCLNAIIDGDAKTAIVRQGMLKGIDKVMHSLNVASKQYKEILESKENEQQLQVQA